MDWTLMGSLEPGGKLQYLENPIKYNYISFINKFLKSVAEFNLKFL